MALSLLQSVLNCNVVKIIQAVAMKVSCIYNEKPYGWLETCISVINITDSVYL